MVSASMERKGNRKEKKIDYKQNADIVTFVGGKEGTNDKAKDQRGKYILNKDK